MNEPDPRGPPRKRCVNCREMLTLPGPRFWCGAGNHYIDDPHQRGCDEFRGVDLPLSGPVWHDFSAGLCRLRHGL